MTTLADKLKKGLEKTYSSKSGKPLFFDEKDYETLYAREFADLFSIPENDRDVFYKAFNIATQGQGDELRKVNSVISSALLSLLTFYPLFGNTDKSKYLTINGERYYRCFFEVRNRVINPSRPSCVDVALISTDDKKILFLESKLSEYADRVGISLELGKSYKSLYEGENGLHSLALCDYLNMEVENGTPILKSLDDKEKIYIEGIKQSISHLIGLVRGPQFYKQGYYPKDYYEEYEDFYKKADVIEYATILFDPAAFEVNTEEFKAYSELYTETIIAHKDDILKCIKNWDNGEHYRGKHIEILDKILTYQGLLSDKNNRRLVAKSVLDYYKL
ncbi:MAG: hypothetical protein K2L14_09700 [Duncaniella sp.]|nr:hypothetical protein [Duncaniella sp.]